MPNLAKKTPEEKARFVSNLARIAIVHDTMLTVEDMIVDLLRQSFEEGKRVALAEQPKK